MLIDIDREERIHENNEIMESIILAYLYSSILTCFYIHALYMPGFGTG